MEAIWGETMEAADELFAYGKHYFCNDSRLCWIINELLGVIWASRELVWWNILALYIHRLVKNTHSVGSWMLVFVWVCLRLSPDVDWLEITHPAERALFIFASTNPVFDDLYIACILLVKLDFLASAWASRRNLGQLPDAVSEMFILSIPVFIKWVIGYMPGTPNPLPDAEKPRPPAKDVERRNRRDNATQLNLGNVPDNALGRRSREGRGRRMWHITPTDLLDTTPTDLRDTTPGDRIADRDNPRCQCKPCHCINPAEPPQRNETRDQGTQTDPDHYGWRDGLNDGYRPPRWQLVCPYNPCRYNIINQGPESFLVDERNPTTPEGAKETDTVEEDEPRYETTPRETSSVTVAPAINLTDEALETDKPRSASPLDPRIPTNSYSTRHTAEIADSPKSRDVPEDTNDTQMEVTNDSPTKITNDSPIDHPPSEPESTAYIPQKASLPDEFQFGFELPMRWELRESQRGFDMDNSSQVHNQPYTPEALPRSIPTVDSPENSSVRKSRSLNDIAGSLQINKFNSPTTSAEVESCDIEMPGIQENINQQDSVKQEAQPGSPRDSGTRQADDFSGPLVLSQPPRLPGFPPAPRTSLPIKSKMYKPSDKGSGLKDLNDDPEDSREIPDDTGRAPEDTCGAPDDEDASEMEDNGPRARETIPTSPFDFESSDSDIYGYSGDDAQPNANTTVASSAIGQKLDTALDAILGTSEAKDRPRDRLSQVLDSDSNSEQSFEREGSPMESVHGEEGSLKEFVHDRESSPMDCDVEQVRDEDSMMGIEEGKRGRHPSQSHHYPRESELVGEYCRSDPDAELSIAELHDTIMGRRNSEEDHSIFDTKADTPGEAPQTADTDMVDSPSTPTQDFGNLDNICNNTQVAPPFTTQGQGFQQTAQAQGSDAFQNSNNGSRFTNMMDEIQGVDYSPGPVPP
ncbi:hypothetical protein B0J13DRAFT_521673 [Dactylonectria estremocensis]|uniref:Uncharacterized protein n=1 Tax=Dactylonectria estremocensis TaxID=1079267 RepID=A0A9P9F8Z2_9HYPO|nr:hypothetical protein B0J13DRAFT_521673 [Dactylonectria estremocensis]